VRNPRLQRLHAEVRSLAAGFRRVEYEHVPRERNKEADRLANIGVDAWLAEGAGQG
jgi:ribonuclease HI